MTLECIYNQVGQAIFALDGKSDYPYSLLSRLSPQRLWLVWAYLPCASSQKSLFYQQGLSWVCLADSDQCNNQK